MTPSLFLFEMFCLHYPSCIIIPCYQLLCFKKWCTDLSCDNGSSGVCQNRNSRQIGGCCMRHVCQSEEVEEEDVLTVEESREVNYENQESLSSFFSEEEDDGSVDDYTTFSMSSTIKHDASSPAAYKFKFQKKEKVINKEMHESEINDIFNTENLEVHDKIVR